MLNYRVTVSSVSEGSRSAVNRVTIGDVVTGVNFQPLSSNFQADVAKMVKSLPRPITINFNTVFHAVAGNLPKGRGVQRVRKAEATSSGAHPNLTPETETEPATLRLLAQKEKRIQDRKRYL